jgi:Type IV secretion-system coupling protein DNA-binding domain
MMPTSDPFIRGQRKLRFKDARDLADSLRATDDPGQFLGGVALPSSCRNKNFAVIGMPGTGKTLTIRDLMRQSFADIPRGGATRGVIYDNKMEFYPFLRGLGIEKEQINLFHTNDRRSVGWDVQADMETIKDARDIAVGFVPRNPKDEAYFIEGARNLVTAVLQAFFLKSRNRDDENIVLKEKGLKVLPEIKWSLRDVFLALDDEEVMRTLFESSAVTKGALKYLGRDNNDLLSTLEGYLKPFQALAAFWEDQPKISFRDWASRKDGQIIILGHDKDDNDTSKTLNRTLFHRLGISLTRGPKYGLSRLTWFFLDELPQMGILISLEDFMPLVRQYGGSFVLGLQSFPHLVEIYGEQKARTILEVCGTFAILKCKMFTAELAAKYIIGSYEATETKKGTQINPRERSMSESEGIERRLAVMPEEITNLDYADEKSGVQAFYISSVLKDRVWFHRLLWDEIKHVFEGDTKDPDHDPEKNGRRFEIKGWEDDEKRKFGLTPEAKHEEDRTTTTAPPKEEEKGKTGAPPPTTEEPRKEPTSKKRLPFDLKTPKK